MRKPAKILLLAVIVALLPLRSMAALMAGSCPAAQEETVAQPTAPAHESALHSGKADTHCPGPACLANAAPAPLLAPAEGRGAVFVQRTGPAFVPDKLDRPPLAPLR